MIQKSTSGTALKTNERVSGKSLKQKWTELNVETQLTAEVA